MAVFIGGGLGSLARFGIFKFLANQAGPSFPLATLLSNILACLIIGAFLFYIDAKTGTDNILRSWVAIGFCGGFSTFSTFSLETLELLKSGNIAFAILNVACSFIICILILWFFAKTN